MPALKEDDAQFFDVVNVDLLAPFELARTAAAAMRTSGRGGNIVMVGSAAAFRSSAQMPTAGYVAAKAGLVGLTRSWPASGAATGSASTPCARGCIRAR